MIHIAAITASATLFVQKAFSVSTTLSFKLFGTFAYTGVEIEVHTFILIIFAII
tara:strand:- start:1478 stop:1639 length:162 start_codon:yes stop_codon:yes gene_type:complete